MSVYSGSCHCSKIQFLVEANIDHVRVCDCSICCQRGALIFRVEENQLTLLSPFDELSVYQWGRKIATDYFCPHCGILPFRRPASPTEREIAEGVPHFKGWAVNARCLEGLDISRLPAKTIHGSTL